MATVRTQREIRQRAPLWLVMLLFANLVIMAIDAKDSNGKQRVVRVWTQAFASPLQSASSKASGATSGFLRQILNFHSTAEENDQLKAQIATLQDRVRTAQQQASENERLKGLLGLKDERKYQVVPARVIARDP